MEYFKKGTSSEDVIVHLLNEVMKMKAENQVLTAMILALQGTLEPSLNPREVILKWNTDVHNKLMEIVANHPIYDDLWKKKLQNQFGDLGIDF